MSNPSLEIDNGVINALWHAIFDVLDKDGIRSIFSYANLPRLTEDILNKGMSPLSLLLKILSAIRDLLQYSPTILLELGKKFSFYLDPMGSNLGEFVKLLNDLLVAIHFDFILISPYEIIVGIEANVEDEDNSLLTDKWLVLFYEGLFSEGIKKTIGGEIKVEIEKLQPNCCKFKINTNNIIKV